MYPLYGISPLLQDDVQMTSSAKQEVSGTQLIYRHMYRVLQMLKIENNHCMFGKIISITMV